MTTITVHASEALAGLLSSAEIRSWLEQFLRQPHTLPRDPGAGYGRVSLALPGTTVNAVAAYSRCSVSRPALRRIAVERMEVPRPPADPLPA